ncbi:MAG: pilus assembly protein [Burkholderiaceae bacterium]
MNTIHLRHAPRTAPNKQGGLSLVTTLLFMVAALMLGVSVLSVNVMQERTIGNTKDRDLALQAAEAALRDAETDLIATNATLQFPLPDQPCSNGLCIPPSKRSPRSSLSVEQAAGFDWATQSRTYGQVTLAAPFPGVNAQPRYVIEKVGAVDMCVPGESCTGGKGGKPATGYRITAFAVGARPETTVILQSMYTVR